jgi:hypothetical protein
VVAATRRGPLGRVVAGDDAGATIDGAACSVPIAPVHYAGHVRPLQRIAEVGLDVQRSAESLVDRSASLDLLLLRVDSYGTVPRITHDTRIEVLTHRASCPVIVIGRSTVPGASTLQ